MFKKIMGIDPGNTGAFAGITLKGDFIKSLEMWDMPLVKTKSGKNEVDPRCVIDILTGFDADYVFIEKAQPMARFGKKQGVASTGGYMKGYGVLLGVIAALGFKYEEVTPQAWKKALLSEAGLDKTASRKRAEEVYEGVKFPLVKDHNKAEAFLIAIYGRMILGW